MKSAIETLLVNRRSLAAAHADLRVKLSDWPDAALTEMMRQLEDEIAERARKRRASERGHEQKEVKPSDPSQGDR